MHLHHIDRMLDPSRVATRLFACWMAVALACTQPNESQTTKPKEAKVAPPASVVVAELTAEPFTRSQRYLGEVTALSNASLAVGEAGRVRKVHVAEGDRVVRGQVLLELEDQLAQAELGRARATKARVEVEHTQASREADRFVQLRRQEIISDRASQIEISQARALDADNVGASATVELMSERLQRHRIIAPFSGTVARRAVDPGDWLAPGQPALQLLTDSNVEVLVNVPATLLDSLQAGSEAQLLDRNRRVEATVTHFVPALNRQTRTALVRLRPLQDATWLRPGADVTVAFAIHRSEGLNIPRDALVYGLSAIRVVRVVDNTAEFLTASLLEVSGDRALVQCPGLEVGDHLVVRGNERLRDGQAVTTQGALSGMLTPVKRAPHNATGRDEPAQGSTRTQ